MGETTNRHGEQPAEAETPAAARERSPHQVHALMRDVGLIPGRVRHFGPTMLVEAIAP